VINVTHRVWHNVVPVYKMADVESEQISQLIWGATVQRLSISGSFSEVIGEDHYSGWVRTQFLDEISDDPDLAVSTIASLFAEIYSKPTASSELITRLTTGARVVLSRSAAVGRFIPVEVANAKIGYVHEGHLSMTYSGTSAIPSDRSIELLTETPWIIKHIISRIDETSRLFVGVPYLWGGTTPFGMDCSGFVQLVYKLNGVQLLRDAADQWGDRRFSTVKTGEKGLNSNAIQVADLVFFCSSLVKFSKVTHVGISLGHGRFVHSVGKGRGNTITDCSAQEFTSTFVGVRRLEGSHGLTIGESND
jgi:hypothetical protein